VGVCFRTESSGGSSQNTLGGELPSAEWGPIISSRWKKLGGLDKKWKAEAPRPRPRTATDRLVKKTCRSRMDYACQRQTD